MIPRANRPKLLFLAYYFPPASAPACVRSWNTARYLSRLGWDVTVVTPQPSLSRRVEKQALVETEIAHAGIKRILTGHRWLSLSPGYLQAPEDGFSRVTGGACRILARRLDMEREVGWLTHADRACRELTARDVDLVLATGSPFLSFTLAKRLSIRTGSPYVLDYRDPWTQNPHAARPPLRRTIRKEASLLADAAAVTVVSPSWASAIQTAFGVGTKVHVVTNGYDPDELGGVKPHEFDHFAIVYTGGFYPPKRVVSPLMAAMRDLKDSSTADYPAWRFHYYGAHGRHVEEEANRYGVHDKVILHGHVSRSESLSAVRGAGATVVITSVSEAASVSDSGILPAKLFEALGLGAPIILIAPCGSDAEKLAMAAGITHLARGGDIPRIVSALDNLIRGNTPSVHSSASLAWPSLSERLDGILGQALDNPTSGC